MRIKPVSLLLFIIGVSILLQSSNVCMAGTEEIDKCIEVYKNQNYVVSARCFKVLAEQGNPAALSWLGLQFAEGKGVQQNYSEASKLYIKAAEKGHADAQFQLAALYQKGLGVKLNIEEAVKWYKKAADQGHRNGQFSLGNIYRDGKGIKQDFSEASRWYKRAAEQGLSTAQSELGFLYISGKGVSQDYDEAVRWFRKAADQGLAVAQINLSHCYEFGKGVPLDYDEAVKWLTKAAAQGNQTAKNKLANFDRYKDKIKAPRLTDSEYLSLGRIAEEKYKDCDTALNSYLEVSEQGRKDPEWSLSTARSFECVKNYREALYYYKKYDAMKPRQTKIAQKMQELQLLLAKDIKGNIPKQTAIPTVSPNTVTMTGSCITNCLQARSACGVLEKCQKAFSVCADSCRENEAWKTMPAASAPASVSEVRYTSLKDYTRVEIRLSDKTDFTKARILNPDRLFFDLKNCKIQKEQQKTIKVDDEMLISIRSGQFTENTVRVVFDLKEGTDYKISTADNPASIIIDIYRVVMTPKAK